MMCPQDVRQSRRQDREWSLSDDHDTDVAGVCSGAAVRGCHNPARNGLCAAASVRPYQRRSQRCSGVSARPCVAGGLQLADRQADVAASPGVGSSVRRRQRARVAARPGVRSRPCSRGGPEDDRVGQPGVGLSVDEGCRVLSSRRRQQLAGRVDPVRRGVGGRLRVRVARWRAGQSRSRAAVTPRHRDRVSWRLPASPPAATHHAMRVPMLPAMP
jgi:hypothetical protein